MRKRGVRFAAIRRRNIVKIDEETVVWIEQENRVLFFCS